MNLDQPKTAAQRASFNSIKHVQAQDKEKWLKLFSSDAVLQDPVGQSPLDPSGNGHKGLEAIAVFWDIAIGSGTIELDLFNSHPCANECANVLRLTKRLSKDVVITTDLVVVYQVDAKGLIKSLKAYWEYDKVASQLEKAFG